MRTEGFWRSSEDDKGSDLPWPVAGQPMPHRHAFLSKLANVEQRAHAVHFRGWSNCRLCGKSNGSATLEYEGWTWPEGFAHYVRDHDVAPSDDFRAFIMSA